MPITLHRVEVEHVEFCLTFHDSDGAGYGFTCDKDGNVDMSALNDVTRNSYAFALQGQADGTFTVEVVDYSRTMRHREGACVCGATLYSYDSYDVSCDRCHREFNCWGQELRSGGRNNPSNWDEDVDDMEGHERSLAGEE